MKTTYAILAGAALLALPTAAEAARCAKGSIYRPSVGVCVSKASAMRAGIYRPRHAKAHIKHRAKKRPPVERAAKRPPVVAASFPPPTPPWERVTPMIEGQIDEALSAPAPTVFVHPRFGGLIAMPDSPAVWAARNANLFQD